MISAFSWQNSISLCPASFHIPRPNLPVPPGVSWLPTFAFQSPIMKRTSFWGVSLKGLVGLHRTIKLQLLQLYWSGDRLGLLWYWIVCLWNKQIILSFLRLHPSTSFWTLFLFLLWGLLHFFWGIPALSSRCNGFLNLIFSFLSILVHWFLKCQCSHLPSPVWPLPMYLDSWI